MIKFTAETSDTEIAFLDFQLTQLRSGLLPTTVNISLKLTSFVSELYTTLANTPP